MKIFEGLSGDPCSSFSLVAVHDKDKVKDKDAVQAGSSPRVTPALDGVAVHETGLLRRS